LDKIGILTSALNAASLRQQAISNNIANAETPNYKAKQVVFEDILKQKLTNQTNFSAKRTDPRHFELGVNAGTQQAMMVTDTESVMQNNGNNVDIDGEMTRMANNSLYYSTLTQQLNSEFQKLSIAIKGRV